MVALPAGFKYRNTWQMNSLRPRMPGGGDPGDCSPASICTAMDLATAGTIDVGIRPYPGSLQKRADMFAQIRRRGGMPSVGGTSCHDNVSAFLTYDAEFAAVNRQKPSCTRLAPGDFDTDIIPALEAGKHAYVGVVYGPIDAYNNHQISGMWGFNKGHGVVITNIRKVNGVNWVTSLDPLADGRLSGSCGCVVAKGPQEVPLSVIRTAAGLYTGEGASPGKASGMIFATKGLIVPDVPGPGPNDILAISTASRITTGAAHGLTTGDYVTMTGTNSTPPLTGPYRVDVVDATTFSVPVAISIAGTTGTWTEVSPPVIGGGEVPVDACLFPASQPT